MFYDTFICGSRLYPCLGPPVWGSLDSPKILVSNLSSFHQIDIICRSLVSPLTSSHYPRTVALCLVPHDLPASLVKAPSFSSPSSLGIPGHVVVAATSGFESPPPLGSRCHAWITTSCSLFWADPRVPQASLISTKQKSENRELHCRFGEMVWVQNPVA